MTHRDDTRYTPEKRKIDSRKTEKELGKKGGGGGVPGSGGFVGRPGDFHWRELGCLGESKETDAQSRRTTTEELSRIQSEAYQEGLEPVLVETFHEMPHPYEKRWARVRLDFLLELLREREGD